MPEIQDLTGKKFGYLTVVCQDIRNGESRKRTYWNCKCVCGNITSVLASNLKRGHTRSCGCKTNSMKHKTHGMSNTRLYKIWIGMKNRCYNPSTPHYEYYGGRGINVCNDWKFDFEPFYKWSTENGYEDGLSIDRIDNGKGYSPDNCRWATKEQQARNKTNLLRVKVNGVEKTLCEWSEICNVPLNALRLRYLRGLKSGVEDFDESLLAPLVDRPRKVNQYSLSGAFIRQWNSAKEAGKAGFGAIGSIRECCSGKNKQHKGYIWKYA